MVWLGFIILTLYLPLKMSPALQALFSEVYFVNERIMTGDIVSNKFALPRVQKLIAEYKSTMEADGASLVSIQPYAAAGGWVGLTYSYCLAGETFQGSSVPRRL